MQGYIIRYVEDLKAMIEPTGCSIHQAIHETLPSYEGARLLKLRDAALDLVRILEVEMGRRQDQAEDDRKFYVYGEDLVAGLTGPFDTVDEAREHVGFCRTRGDADPGIAITGHHARSVREDDPGILVMTPEEDREFDVEAVKAKVLGRP